MSKKAEIVESVRSDLATMGVDGADIIAEELMRRCTTKDACINEYFSNSEVFENLVKARRAHLPNVNASLSDNKSGGGVFRGGSSVTSDAVIVYENYSIDDKVQLSPIYKSVEKCIDAVDGPLLVGETGVVVNRNSKRNGNEVMTSRGEKWWYTKDALVVIKLTKEEQLLKNICAMGFPDDEKAKKAAKMHTSIEAALGYLTANEEDTKGSIVEIACGICITDYPSNEMVTLNCEHRVCNACFEAYCTSKINDNLVDEASFTCPCVETGTNKLCKSPITQWEVEAHCPKPIYEKYIRFLNQKLFDDSLKLLRCPKCNEFWIDMPLDARYENMWKLVECQRPECKHTFCGKCGEKPHKGQKDQNLTCDEFQAWKRQNDRSVADFDKFMAENKVQKCPVCKNAVDRLGGCKYLYCKCSCNLCALCGVELDESQHFTHFKNKPFGEECNGVVDVTKKTRPKK